MLNRLELYIWKKIAIKMYLSFIAVLAVGALVNVSSTVISNDNIDDVISGGVHQHPRHRFVMEDEGEDGGTHGTCIQHELDFVLVEGDAVRSSVEQEIVAMLAEVGIKVNTRKLTKEEFNAAEQAGDFHLSFSETWGAPYDPHAYAKGWITGDEGHNQALSGNDVDRARIYDAIETVLMEENYLERGKQWEDIHKMVHSSATMLPLWGKRIPTILNNRLTKWQPGNQQFDYPVHTLQVLDGSSSTVTISPGAQTGLFASVGRLDPHTYRPNEFFSSAWIYEGLVTYGREGQIIPALAQSWTVSDDGLQYTFQLRPGVTFHDGTEWNCSAAKLNFDHVLAEPLRTSDWHGWYGLIDQISSWECTPDENDLEFIVTTKNKYYPFLQELSFIRPLRMLSPAAFANDADPLTSNSCHVGWGTIESTTDDTGDTVVVVCAGITDISGTGPYMYDSRESVDLVDDDTGETTTVDNKVIFQANPNYWDGSGQPSIETLIIQRYEDSDAVKAALLDGSLDILWGSGILPTDDLIELDTDESNGLSVFYSDDIQNVIILLNSGKAPLDDSTVRKTVIHAIDKKKIIDDNLGGLFKPVDNVFPRDAPYSDVDITPRWDYDLEKAQFLNCPLVKEEGDSGKSNNALAIGLGVGLGAAALVLLAVAYQTTQHNKRLETELEGLKMKDGAVGV